MKERVEKCAETVWEALGRVRAMNILRLAEYLGERSVVTYQALGWLAREGRVQYDQRGNQVFVRLTDAEQSRYEKLKAHQGGSKE